MIHSRRTLRWSNLQTYDAIVGSAGQNCNGGRTVRGLDSSHVLRLGWRSSPTGSRQTIDGGAFNVDPTCTRFWCEGKVADKGGSSLQDDSTTRIYRIQGRLQVPTVPHEDPGSFRMTVRGVNINARHLRDWLLA